APLLQCVSAYVQSPELMSSSPSSLVDEYHSPTMVVSFYVWPSSISYFVPYSQQIMYLLYCYNTRAQRWLSGVFSTQLNVPLVTCGAGKRFSGCPMRTEPLFHAIPSANSTCLPPCSSLGLLLGSVSKTTTSQRTTPSISRWAMVFRSR